MDNTKIILVGTLANKDQPTLYPMVGLGYLEQFLYFHGIKCQTYDLRIDRLKGLKKLIKKNNSEYVGFYLATMNFSKNLSIIKEIKDEFPNVKIIVGGPHVSTMREKLLIDNLFIDYGCVLEGEEILKELILQEKDVSDIKGLIYRNPSGKIIFNGERAVQNDLNQFPYPRYESLNLKKYSSNIISIITSRGCPFSCSYCPVSTTIGKKFRVRSPENIIEELKYWADKGYCEFYFMDDNFTLLKERVLKFCELLTKEGLHKKITLSLPNGIRADKVDYENLKIMRSAGFSTIAFGVESANDHVLKKMKKEEKLADIDRAIKNACELGFNVRLFFIIGHPGESYSDFENSIKFAKKYPVISAVFYNLIPFPKTELFSWVQNNNLYINKDEINLMSLEKYDHWIEYPIFETSEMNRYERIKAYRLGLKISNEIQFNYFKAKFSKKLRFLPGLHWIAYYVFSDRIFQKIYTRNKFLRRYIETFKSYLVHGK